jgi:peptidoglycan L-alanyl-D-glutamate endopeptidase CwlK
VINSRDIHDLLPQVKHRAEMFLFKCLEAGIDVILTSTYRDAESQTAIYAQGRTTPGKIVTRAKAGQSFHNYAVAFDFCPIVNGKAQWNDTKAFERCGEIAESVGLEWAGRWIGFKELAHCQYTGGLKLADFQAGKLPPVA